MKNNIVSIDTPTTTRKPRTKKQTDVQRFLSNVGKPTVSGCQLWQGGAFQSGYGLFSRNSVNEYAHRVAWEIANKQSIPAGAMVLHHPTCTSRLCCAPCHLRLGDAKANALDRIACGRSGKGSVSTRRGFTAEEKTTIARLHIQGFSNYAIAAQLGRSQPGIAYQLKKNQDILASKLRKKAAGITTAVQELSKAITDLYGDQQKAA